jgi:hypothetical protein
MARVPLPPEAVVVSFVDRINRGDPDGLAGLMTDDHRLQILDEDPVDGREANVAAWRGYFSAYPEYVIYPRELFADGGRVMLVGTTTGSHLGLPDAEEREHTVVWIADVVEGALSLWRIVDA